MPRTKPPKGALTNSSARSRAARYERLDREDLEELTTALLDAVADAPELGSTGVDEDSLLDQMIEVRNWFTDLRTTARRLETKRLLLGVS